MRPYMRQAVPDANWPAPRDQIKLGDLCSWHLLAVMCGGCGHAVELIPNRLRLRCSDYDRIQDIEPRMRCSRCKRRGGHGWTILKLPR